MTGILRRWFITLEEARGPTANLPLLLNRQDNVMRAINDQILSADWFGENSTYDYTTRKNRDGVGLWFQFIQDAPQQADIESQVNKALTALCSFKSRLETQQVLPSQIDPQSCFRSLFT